MNSEIQNITKNRFETLLNSLSKDIENLSPRQYNNNSNQRNGSPEPNYQSKKLQQQLQQQQDIIKIKTDQFPNRKLKLDVKTQESPRQKDLSNIQQQLQISNNNNNINMSYTDSYQPVLIKNPLTTNSNNIIKTSQHKNKFLLSTNQNYSPGRINYTEQQLNNAKPTLLKENQSQRLLNNNINYNQFNNINTDKNFDNDLNYDNNTVNEELLNSNYSFQQRLNNEQDLNQQAFMQSSQKQEKMASQAYIDAMKALQDRVKVLEFELVGVNEEKQRIINNYEQEQTNNTRRFIEELSNGKQQEKTFKQNLDQLSDQVNQQQNIIDQLKQQNHEYTQQLLQLNKERGQYIEKINHLNVLLEMERKSKDDIKLMLGNQQNQYEQNYYDQEQDNQNKLKEINIQLVNEKQQNEEMKRNLFKLQQEYDEFKIKMKDLETKLQKNQEESNQLKNILQQQQQLNPNQFKNQQFTQYLQQQQQQSVFTPGNLDFNNNNNLYSVNNQSFVNQQLQQSQQNIITPNQPNQQTVIEQQLEKAKNELQQQFQSKEKQYQEKIQQLEKQYNKSLKNEFNANEEKEKLEKQFKKQQKKYTQLLNDVEKSLHSSQQFQQNSNQQPPDSKDLDYYLYDSHRSKSSSILKKKNQKQQHHNHQDQDQLEDSNLLSFDSDNEIDELNLTSPKFGIVTKQFKKSQNNNSNNSLKKKQQFLMHQQQLIQQQQQEQLYQNQEQQEQQQQQLQLNQQQQQLLQQQQQTIMTPFCFQQQQLLPEQQIQPQSQAQSQRFYNIIQQEQDQRILQSQVQNPQFLQQPQNQQPQQSSFFLKSNYQEGVRQISTKKSFNGLSNSLQCPSVTDLQNQQQLSLQQSLQQNPTQFYSPPKVDQKSSNFQFNLRSQSPQDKFVLNLGSKVASSNSQLSQSTETSQIFNFLGTDQSKIEIHKRELYDAEDEVRALNSRYEELINMAKNEQNSQQKSSIRKALIELSDKINKANEKVYILKKKQQYINSKNEINSKIITN